MSLEDVTDECGRMAERSKALESGPLSYLVRKGASSNLASVKLKPFSSSLSSFQRLCVWRLFFIIKENPLPGLLHSHFELSLALSNS